MQHEFVILAEYIPALLCAVVVLAYCFCDCFQPYTAAVAVLRLLNTCRTSLSSS
jgi:hypothetical protein